LESLSCSPTHIPPTANKPMGKIKGKCDHRRFNKTALPDHLVQSCTLQMRTQALERVSAQD
jgi:hypothetical protein